MRELGYFIGYLLTILAICYAIIFGLIKPAMVNRLVTKCDVQGYIVLEGKVITCSIDRGIK